MSEQEIEQFISKMASGLPRRSVPVSDKQAVWLRLQDYLRSQRVEQAGWPLFHYFRFRFSRALVATIVAVVSVSLVGGMAKAARGSLPGQTLYSVKKAVEQVEVAIASARSQEKKVQTLKVHAQTRLGEVATLVAEKKVAAPVVQKSLQDLEDAAKEVVAASEARPELATHAVELAQEEEQILTAVATQVEGEVKDQVQKVLTASRESLSKLQSGESGKDQVKGTAVEDQTAGAATPTSTPAQAAKKTVKPKDGVFQSQIQLHDITSSSEGNVGERGRPPTILDESAAGF